jgi:4-hydroxysphinganine ceramide fatty acyl 2-hydroxylase
MPSRTLPTFLPSEIASKNTSKSCYVTMGTKVYDVTDFLDSHPGGGELILEYGGKDITDILKDEDSHTHSEAAYEVLDDSLVGFLAMNGGIAKTKLENGSAGVKLDGTNDEGTRLVFEATGVASAEDLSKETDLDDDYKKYKFLDLNKPLLMQVFFGGFSKRFYLEQVHRPRHYKGGDSAPIFGNFLEPLSKTPWWIIPIIWLPPVVYGTYLSREGLSGWPQVASCFGLGVFIWTLVEYILHRFLFHLDEYATLPFNRALDLYSHSNRYLPDNRVAITLHFLLHGVHHYLPMDKYRLVMPPTLFVVLAYPFWKLAHTIFSFNWHMGTAVYCGGIFGYICYDLTHYFLHHKNLPPFYKELKKWHLQHHFMDYENGFGVTSRFWDVVFGTKLVQPTPKIVKVT